MPDFTVKDHVRKDPPSVHESTSQLEAVSRQSVIEMGVFTLHVIGSDSICKVCIFNGGSCCYGCRQLVDGVGCQQRNTGCTAWLCGFLKFLLYETGLLQEWNEFWDQVPGQGYREDFTPEAFFIKKNLHLPNIRNLGEALAADLEELSKAHIALGFIITLREKINKHIDQLDECENNPKQRTKIKRKIKMLSYPFQRFHRELRDYHNKLSNLS